MVETALRCSSSRAEAALLVGDTFGEDVGAAHAAGIDAAWIDHAGIGVPMGARPPRFILRALPELRAVLDRGAQRSDRAVRGGAATAPRSRRA